MHRSVLLHEALEFLKCEDKRLVLDCTIGGAGHAKEILKRLPPGGRLIGIDADKGALKLAEENLKGFEGAFVLANSNFRNFDQALRRLNMDGVDAMLFDLGISSFQLDASERGFSFSKGGTLDMRMNQDEGRPLWQILKNIGADELALAIRDLGEERFWRRIAKAIIAERKKSAIINSLELAELIRRAAGYRRPGRIDPATRTFQALRILVNDELNALKEALGKFSPFLKKGGRIVAISFHSLEDRIVKNSFRELAKEGVLEVLTKKPVVPGELERIENPRSRSAKLRAAERI